MFRVVPDQLRVSQGWVRCGRCDEVFDANSHMCKLLQEPASETTPESPALEQAEPTPSPETVNVQDVGSYDWGSVLDGGGSQPASHPQDDSFLEKSPQELLAASPQNLHAEVVASEDLPVSLFPPESDQHEPKSLQIPLSDDLANVSFMALKPVAPKHSRGASGLWGLALALLVLAIGLQFIVHERDRLAAGQPALQPALVALCEVLACKINALKQIDSIVIDSSTFSKVQPDVYKLSVTLKNTASLEVAKPSLELTLTDSQDQAVIRKVILPADLGDKVEVIARADEVSWVIPISVKPMPGAAQIAGYRVLAFYP